MLKLLQFLILKYHKIKPLGIFPRGIYDEVYQAALESGQGGIRYNDSLKQIQLMDTNKNWVNWRSFDAHSIFKVVGSVITTNYSHVFTADGLYLFIHCSYSVTVSNLTTTAQRKDLLLNQLASGSRYCSLVALSAVQDQTFNATMSGSNGCAMTLFYIGSGINIANVTLETYKHGGNDNAESSLSISNVTNKILIGAVSGSSSRIINCSGTTNQVATDSSYYGCVSTYNETGSGTFSGKGNSAGNSFVAIVTV